MDVNQSIEVFLYFMRKFAWLICLKMLPMIDRVKMNKLRLKNKNKKKQYFTVT